MSIFYPVPGGRIVQVTRDGAVGVHVIVDGLRRLAYCPDCGQRSHAVHSRYQRRPADLPACGCSVRLTLRLRRFFCRNAACARRTFVERLPELLAPRVQRTLRLAAAQATVGVSVGAEAGRRLLEALGMPASATTLLRLVRALPLPASGSPRVVGVDDWAMKKGVTYGAILVDLERHRVVDLLADRTAATLAGWLEARPGIEIIARDRSTEFARGASQGAPAAVQVADRWHLLHNAKAMLERWLAGVHGRLRRPPSMGVEAESLGGRAFAYPRTTAELAASAESRSRWQAVYEEVQRRWGAGQSLSAISRAMGLARGTVRRFAQAKSFPIRSVRAPEASILDPHLPWLKEQLAAGADNASSLWRELRERGFVGGPRQVLRWMGQRRASPSKRTPCSRRLVLSGALPSTSSPAALPSPKSLAWLLLRAPETLGAPETLAVARAEQDPEVARVASLTRDFVALVRTSGRERHDAQSPPASIARFEDWLDRAAACGVGAPQTFAAGLHQDGAAVRAALTLPWSSGQAEGQINRLKLLKRQMYGRAGFDLLRRRVLLAH